MQTLLAKQWRLPSQMLPVERAILQPSLDQKAHINPLTALLIPLNRLQDLNGEGSREAHRGAIKGVIITKLQRNTFIGILLIMASNIGTIGLLMA